MGIIIEQREIIVAKMKNEAVKHIKHVDILYFIYNIIILFIIILYFIYNNNIIIIVIVVVVVIIIIISSSSITQNTHKIAFKKYSLNTNHCTDFKLLQYINVSVSSRKTATENKQNIMFSMSKSSTVRIHIARKFIH